MSELLAAWRTHHDSFLGHLLTFLSLAAQGVGLALTVGIPLGVALSRTRRLSSLAMSLLALIQTVPSLALLGLLIPVIGIGRPPALAVTVLYSLLPIVMNTAVGISQVSGAVTDAARGMGMTGTQRLWKVELPLALPVILAGVRTGVVYAIGVITICALAGAGGLGEYITRGLSRGDNGLVLLGAVPILLITLIAFWGIGAVSWLARRNAAQGMIVAVAFSLSLAGFAVFESFADDSPDLIIGSKNFTENVVLAEMMRILLEEESGLRIETRHGLGSNLAYKAIMTGQIDLYPEYTGTLLTAVDALNRDVPKDRSVITDLVRKEIGQRFDLILLRTFGLNNTHAMCIPRGLARRRGLKTIGDLASTPDLKAVVASEFLDRPDGWFQLAETYAIQLKEPPRTMEPELMYVAMREGRAQLCSGFSTDWQIDAYDLVVLKDDRNYFPSYHAAPLVRGEVLKRFPQIERILNRLGGQIDDEAIRRLNGRVARERLAAATVAREFLLERNLISK